MKDIIRGGFARPTAQERRKYRAAQAAGLLERVLEVGWAGLSAKESGKIGGILAHLDLDEG
ncbi:MAG: small acid-soluble spore protein alpha/beta type [Clostridia bacterium]|nr:small acid-soluble spore protein alpha/beta type [Clostridia bacterium]